MCACPPSRRLSLHTCALHRPKPSALHAMAVLQVFQAKLLQSLEGGTSSPEAVSDLRAATDFALMATKRTAQAIGRTMGFMVVQQRHLWLTLVDLKDGRCFWTHRSLPPASLAMPWSQSSNSLRKPKSAPRPWAMSCQGTCSSHLLCLFSCMLFNKNTYILRKRALSSSPSQCDAARPAWEQCRATAHTKDSHASLASSSVDQAIKAAISVPESVGSYSGNLALATPCDKAWVYPSIQTQTTPFQRRGAVSNIASKLQVLREEVRNLLKKGAIEKVPQSEQESGFYSRYFVMPKRDSGLHPILDLRPINRALGKRPFRISIRLLAPSRMLSFLQYRLDSGSLPSTLKVYVAAIASFRSPQGGQSIGYELFHSHHLSL